MPALEIYAVALPTPLRRTFDYLAPQTVTQGLPGMRVAVNFGNQKLVGVIVDIKDHSDFDLNKLKPVEALLDSTPLIPEELLQLCQWAARYYHHPLGEVLAAAIPVALRQGETAELSTEKAWQLTESGNACSPDDLKRARKQQALLQLLKEGPLSGQPYVLHKDLLLQDVNRPALKGLQDKGLIEPLEITPDPIRPEALLKSPPLQLNEEQANALDQIEFDQYGGHLLYGTTGSGKTEVYLQAIEKVLRAGRQALVLIPEIGLTPQTLSRFQSRFNRPLAVLHSSLNDSERKQAWLLAAAGDADIIIGTRSAIFTPMKHPGIVILDEEHDPSFKQQEGFRYSARDLAALRCQRLGIPLILGSATPSLESFHNAQQQRYRLLPLTQRAGGARPPTIELIDLKRQPLQEGLTQALLDSIEQHLLASGQVLVFINRRGFAPTLMCHDCGWLSQCQHCDARLTVHQNPAHLHCHHCDYQRPLIHQCPTCNSRELHCVGQGSERTETILQNRFADFPVLRVDRDSTRQKNAMHNIIEQVNRGAPCILVGTQMLAKGHHFPNVTLVAIIDADGGLFSTDFRGPERMGQLMLQVAGRAGRAERPGTVLIQSHLCEHPMLQTLLHQGYSAFAQLILQERQVSMLPPYRYMALLRAESKRSENAHALLLAARQIAERLSPSHPDLQYLGPLPAPMERRNQRFRHQLQLHASSRSRLHQLLTPLIAQLEQHPLSRRTRWSIDVDPQDMA
ncbi:primosomal protein N' [Aestuariicella sp. G3-2]|uniref:primosomal protein N' n=1 Tax=Pseudomaricurvus albidus TaxID=2842452 RepID=UPI001C0CA63B|nr:primosomal protein N' [Aestuariicella albida]MBU3068364.1 primosomal protein N' [Aestuariicella albida]